MGPNMKCSQRIPPRVPPTHAVDTPAILGKCSECQTMREDGLPKFRTPMLMLQKVGNVERKMGVVLSIYSTNFDMYAVVSQDRNIVVKDCGYIKLKNCSVTTDREKLILEIVQKNYEGVPLRFKVYKSEHLNQITELLQLNTEDDIFCESNIPLSCSPTGSAFHPGFKKVIRSNSPVSRSPRVSPNAKRKLSMPVLAEDEEREELEETHRLTEEDEGCESEE